MCTTPHDMGVQSLPDILEDDFVHSRSFVRATWSPRDQCACFVIDGPSLLFVLWEQAYNQDDAWNGGNMLLFEDACLETLTMFCACAERVVFVADGEKITEQLREQRGERLKKIGDKLKVVACTFYGIF